MTEQEKHEYTKQEAAEYLGVSVSTIWYHKRVSQKLAPGIVNRFGRLVWTKDELDAFKSLEIEGGRPRKSLSSYMTPREYMRAVDAGNAPAVTLDGRPVLSVKPDKLNKRQFIISTVGGSKGGGLVWNNTQLKITESAE